MLKKLVNLLARAAGHQLTISGEYGGARVPVRNDFNDLEDSALNREFGWTEPALQVFLAVFSFVCNLLIILFLGEADVFGLGAAHPRWAWKWPTRHAYFASQGFARSSAPA